MTSFAISLSGNSSTLCSYLQPEIELDDRYSYSLALLDLHTYNSIPNVNHYNNKFVVRHKQSIHILQITEGSYEIDELIEQLNQYCIKSKLNILFKTNKNTFKCTIFTDEDLCIDFSFEGSVGPILGFDHKKLIGKSEYVSEKIINIQNINALRVQCDLTAGAYHNGNSSHTIYESSPSVGPGYKIIEQPVNLIYLPVNRKRINSVCITICDQQDRLVNFRNETITCRLHIKRDN